MIVEATVLIVDDDDGMRFFLREALVKAGHSVETAPSGQEAIEAVRNGEYHVVLMDVRMPSMNGLEALQRIRTFNQEIVPVILTAYGSETMTVDALGPTGGSYLTKPVSVEHLRNAVSQALEQFKQNRRLRSSTAGRLLESDATFSEIVGTSARMMEVRDLVVRVAQGDVTVLITGESGTGKELVAKAIHTRSDRAQGPFVGLNCSAIPDTLLESELFGYEKGAFTGADARKLGKFELAEGGTLFLDEVADMPLLTQAKLLRVLQEREFERVGGCAPVPANVRIIAATNKNLDEEVREKRFREDLFYRLNVVPIMLPPLRERREDIPHLVEVLVDRFNQSNEKKVRHISVASMEALMNYPWPGNVRELENVLQRAIVLEQGDTLTDVNLPSAGRAVSTSHWSLDTADFSVPLSELTNRVVARVEQEMISTALEQTGWNRSKTAEMLRISVRSLYNKMRKYGLGGDGQEAEE